MERRIILQGTVGSVAYGLATPESDVDKLGVFVVPTKELFKINSKFEASVVRNNPDLTLHELGKFCSLCAQANPTAMEPLWLNQWDVMDDDGYTLRLIRDAFLSQRVRKTYGGYARQQMDRLENRGDGSFSSKLRKRKEKHARHLVRLTLQGSHLLATGELQIRMTEEQVELCREVSQESDANIRAWFEDAIQKMNAIESDLPYAPDYDLINDAVSTIRMRNL